MGIVKEINVSEMETVRWNNAMQDAAPLHGQLVLVSVKGIYYVTEYDDSGKIYRLLDDKQTFFDPTDVAIYWTDFTN